ncbi:MAG TPA: methyltransferase domain-containing protein [Burkholderiales bacterium]|nr:methyltransferase domain-containing protein [Burkholderiales bacterium]
MPSAADLPQAGKRLLNVGCGLHFHPAWVNVDVVPASSEVIAVDVRKGLPFADRTFDAVYCSHVLEHLSQHQAAGLLEHMHRVLRPGGIIRIAVPDLETLTREYLRLLDHLNREPQASAADYDWIVLELYDQAVRSRSGGEMSGFLAAPNLPNREFVLSRIGAEAERAWQAARAPPATRVVDRIRARGLRWLLRAARVSIAGVLIGVFGGRTAKAAYLEGVFRQSGEVHRWMYDSFSLGRALNVAGFVNARRCTAFESAVPGFSSYALDVDERKRIRKPDSLFMEAERARV